MTVRTKIGVGLIAAALAVPAFATTVAKLSLEQLVQRSDLIVQGQVQSVLSQWDEGRRLVFTTISIRVDESLKGDRPPSVVIRQVGGTVGTVQMSVDGLPQFKSGERALVFLKRLDASSFLVVGMNQGVYRIVDTSAVSSATGMELRDTVTGEITKPLIGVHAPLEQLKSRIRELL